MDKLSSYLSLIGAAIFHSTSPSEDYKEPSLTKYQRKLKLKRKRKRKLSRLSRRINRRRNK